MMPRLCINCRYSCKVAGSQFVRCVNTIINADNAALLGDGLDYDAVYAQDERAKRWFGRCGMPGKLWEARE